MTDAPINKLVYAGIGSRKTPTHILNIMQHIGAYLCAQGWTLRSGAADGADRAFEQGIDDQLLSNAAAAAQEHALFKEIYLPWEGFNHSTSQLHPGNMPFSQEEMDFTARFHPAWHKCSPSAKLLHQRNTRILLGCAQVSGEHVLPAKFVVCWTDRGEASGGTGQALRIAQALDIPVINLGKAKNPAELEEMVLEVDRLQELEKATHTTEEILDV